MKIRRPKAQNWPSWNTGPAWRLLVLIPGKPEYLEDWVRLAWGCDIFIWHVPILKTWLLIFILVALFLL